MRADEPERPAPDPGIVDSPRWIGTRPCNACRAASASSKMLRCLVIRRRAPGCPGVGGSRSVGGLAGSLLPDRSGLKPAGELGLRRSSRSTERAIRGRGQRRGPAVRSKRAPPRQQAQPGRWMRTSRQTSKARQPDQDDVGLARLCTPARSVRKPLPPRPRCRRRWPAAAAAVDAVAAGRALEPLEERLVAAIVVQAQQSPAAAIAKPAIAQAGSPDRRPGRYPSAKPRARLRSVVHQVVEIDPVQAGRAAPAGDLAVDVIEPEPRWTPRHAESRSPRASPVPIASAPPGSMARAASVTWWAESPRRIASQVP